MTKNKDCNFAILIFYVENSRNQFSGAATSGA